MAPLDYDAQDTWPQTFGHTQSPIDIQTNLAQPMPYSAPIKLSYHLMANYVRDTGRNIEVGLTGMAEIAKRPFALQQFHIHAPSEHMRDGQHFDAEIHFVHGSPNGQLAVIGIFLQLGAPSPLVAQMLTHVNREEPLPFNVADLLPTNKSYHHYMGSLTTPPLTENVEWYILDHTLTLSAEQLQQLHVHYHRNNRDVQPLHERLLLHHLEQ